MATRGRKTKYTPETVDKITQAIRLGATYQLACDYAGIGTTVFYQWMNTKPEFMNTIKAAEGEGALKHLINIDRAANGIKDADGQWVGMPDWKASAWKLERRYPEMYGRRVTELTGANGGAIVVKGYEAVSPDDWTNANEPTPDRADSDV